MNDARKIYSAIIGILISMFVLVPADMLFGDRHATMRLVPINIALLAAIICIIIGARGIIRHKMMVAMIASVIAFVHFAMAWLFGCA